MSFSQNPYKHIHIRLLNKAAIHLECESCGGGWEHVYSTDITVARLFEAQELHLTHSHKLTREEVAHWG